MKEIHKNNPNMKKAIENVFHSSTLTDENAENVPGYSLNILEVLPARPARHCCVGRKKRVRKFLC